jgi:Mg-chelatase subunit ChlD
MTSASMTTGYHSVSLLPEMGSVTVSTILDVSGSMTPPMMNNAAAGIRALRAALRDRDRQTLYAFAADVRRIVLSQTRDDFVAESIARTIRQTGGAHTALCDALFAAIVHGYGSGPTLAAVLTDAATTRAG